MSQFTQPTDPNLEPLLSKIWQKWAINLPEIPYFDDFGKEIHKLLLSAPIHDRRESLTKSFLAKKRMWEGFNFVHTAANMRALAKELGFEIVQTNTFFYPRDPFILLKDGSIKIPHFSTYLETVLKRTHSSNLYLDKTAATRTKNQLFTAWSGYTSHYMQDALQTYAAAFDRAPQSFTYTYVEGGNVWTLTNRDGIEKVLMGRDHLTHTHHLLELENHAWNHFQLEFSEEEIARGAEEMFSEGLLMQEGRTGLLDSRQQLDILLAKFKTGTPTIDPAERGWFRNVAEKAGYIPLFKPDVENVRGRVVEHLTKKKMTQAYMAGDFQIAPENLHFITQFNYHLDIFTRPGPHHSVFLLNFAIVAELLEALQEGIALSKPDQEHLQRYLETARKLDVELGPLLKQVAQELEAAGFFVIPMPGHFLYESKTLYAEFPMPSEGFSINFMNALSGWSSTKNCYYYITHGLQVGERLGGLIMGAFTSYLRSYISEIECDFIGRDPQNLTDFSEAMDGWNRLETQSGIHCTTFEY